MIGENAVNRKTYETYILFQAIKRHFSDKKYDFFKYNGKVKAMKYETFETRGDSILYSKISKRADKQNFILSNVLKNPNLWIKDLYDEKAEETHTEWKKRTSALTYVFTQDLNALDDDYRKNFEVSSGQHPNLIRLILQHKISIETFAILCDISNVYDTWQESISDKFIALPVIEKAKKYTPFLDIDRKKYSTIVKNRFF